MKGAPDAKPDLANRAENGILALERLVNRGMSVEALLISCCNPATLYVGGGQTA
jgi:hypothetical protein